MDQQQHAEVEASRKKGFWLVARSPAGCVLDRVIRNLQMGGFPTAPRGGTYFGAEIVSIKVDWVKV